MKETIKNFIAAFLLQLVITLPFYTASVYGLGISNIKVAAVTSNSATIEWDTENISNGKVKYGKTASLGYTQRHDNYVQNHTLTLYNGIDSDSTYFFAVESTDLTGNTAIDNNSGSHYTFKTTDITPPPQVTGLTAASKTSDSIYLSWNSLSIADLKHYIVYKNRVPFANSTTTSFNDTGLSSDTSFSYKVSAADSTGNEGPLSDTLIASTSGVDSAPPLISNVDFLPISDTTAKITWITDENATTSVLYGINKTDKTKSLSELVTNHTILIDGLAKNVQFVFAVKSCDQSDNCAISSNKTLTAGKDILPPFINLSIPRFVNRRAIDIIGSTEPFSSITLFVNDMNAPKRSLGGNEIGSSGRFVFSQVQLEQDNIIKVAAADKSGNKNEKIFQVSVDTQDPIVKLNDIPSIISNSNLTISGNANEPVLMKVFMDSDANVSSVPSKITGLNATRVGQNFIEIHWKESTDNDFSHYVVYRADSSPIAVTKPADFNFFIDALVDSGKSYTYEVSAVNIFGREGPKSNPVTITALLGGAILHLNPPEVDIFEDFRKPLKILNGSGNFNFAVKLDKGDGIYNIKLVFEDFAGNLVLFEKTMALDTKIPLVKVTNPPSGALIFENVASNIDVIGITEPNAKVHLFVDRTPFSRFNQSLELTDIPPTFANEIQNIPEAELDAKCRLNVASKSFCSTGADFSTTADSQGNFKFEGVDLTATFGGAARLQEVPLTQLRDTQLNPESKDSKTTTLVVIATDKAGLRGVVAPKIRIGTCWSGNQSWDIIPLTRYQSPAFISTERLAEGTETAYFYFNFSYIGAGANAKINSGGISISKACSNREASDPRFNISCQIMPSGVPTKSLNPPDNTVSYSAMTLSRLQGMDKFLENDWKSFFKAINKEMTFPVKIRITYKHDTNNDNVLETETQTTCDQISYIVDNSIIDPRKVLPDWLLFDFVDFLQDSIKSLTQLQEQIDKLVDFVAVGCLTSFGLNFITSFYRRWIEFWDEKSYSLLKKGLDVQKVSEIFGKNPLNPANKNDMDDCQKIVQDIAEKKGSFKMKYLTDADLKKCFTASASAWENEARVYSFMRYSCDRIFGHSSPSRWTETKVDEELLRKVQAPDGCKADGDDRGQPLKAEYCRTAISSFPLLPRGGYNPDDKCFIVQTDEGKALYKLSDPVGGEVYKMDIITGPSKLETDYVKKIDEVNYLTHQSKTCQQICGVGVQGGKKATMNIKDANGVRNVEIIPNKDGSGSVGQCLTVTNCRSLNAKDADKKVLLKTEVDTIRPKIVDGKEIKDSQGKVVTETVKLQEDKEVKYARTWGYTKDCFYGKDDASTDVVGTSPDTKEVCCCISFAGKAVPATSYYQPDDRPIYEPPNYVVPVVHESKIQPGQTPQGSVSGDGKDNTAYADMKWSYRYWKERFEAIGSDGKPHNEYNKYRYTEGRDFPACFGMNSLLYENPLGLSFGSPERVLTLNPSKDHVAALQCAHLAGLSQRIQFLKNLMTSMSTCLIQVRTSGRGDSGACKELFTQYLCNAIWQIVQFLVDKGCTNQEFGPSSGEQSDTFATYLQAGFKGAYGAINDMQTSLSQEYGNAKLNELIGTGEESVARKICLGAFGYDWEFNVKNLVDAAYSTSFATLVQAITSSREFLTVDPVTHKPKYEYRASWIINPGCDFERYDVYLACVGRKQLDLYSNQINCGAVGAPSVLYSIKGPTLGLEPSTGFNQCDCLGLPDEKLKSINPGKSLKQNVLEDRSFHQVIDDNYRYDHLLFVLRPDRKIPSNLKPNCFPTGYDDGKFYFPISDRTARDILDCRVDAASGALICGSGAAFSSAKGTAEFLDIFVNGDDAMKKLAGQDLVAEAGQPLKVDVTVRNIGPNKCLIMTFDNQPYAEMINQEGIQQYTIHTQSLTLGTRADAQSSNPNIQVEKISSGLSDVSMFVKFLDMDKNGMNLVSGVDQIIIQNQPKAMDEIRNAPNSKVTIGDGTEQVEISIENDRLTLAKQGARVAILSVQTPPNSFGIIPEDTTFKVPYAEGQIRIFKPTDTTSTTQLPQPSTKTLNIGLYHTTDTSGFGGIESCSRNDKVLTASGTPQERSFRIIVQQKLTGSGQQGILISPETPSRPFRKGADQIQITAGISYRTPIQTAQISCKAPDGMGINTVDGTLLGNNKYQFFINPDNLQIAGKYSCEIAAQSGDTKSSPARVEFEVLCGNKVDGYGFCRDGCLPPTQPISVTFVNGEVFDCGQELGVCCNR
ncbi:hypothetical protein HYW20_07220 [Candidatus Woesearchaeota archaeon]|nr:hypothetical protein [Candidatus Woesearchaeota archaeon]